MILLPESVRICGNTLSFFFLIVTTHLAYNFMEFYGSTVVERFKYWPKYDTILNLRANFFALSTKGPMFRYFQTFTRRNSKVLHHFHFFVL